MYIFALGKPRGDGEELRLARAALPWDGENSQGAVRDGGNKRISQRGPKPAHGPGNVAMGGLQEGVG